MLLALGAFLVVVVVIVAVELLLYVLGGMPPFERLLGRLERRVTGRRLFRLLAAIFGLLKLLRSLLSSFLRRVFGK